MFKAETQGIVFVNCLYQGVDRFLLRGFSLQSSVHFPFHLLSLTPNCLTPNCFVWLRLIRVHAPGL